MSEWISVEAQLPPLMTGVLILTEEVQQGRHLEKPIRMTTGFLFKLGDDFIKKDEVRWSVSGNVIAWMSLPGEPITLNNDCCKYKWSYRERCARVDPYENQEQWHTFLHEDCYKYVVKCSLWHSDGVVVEKKWGMKEPPLPAWLESKKESIYWMMSEEKPLPPSVENKVICDNCTYYVIAEGICREHADHIELCEDHLSLVKIEPTDPQLVQKLMEKFKPVLDKLSKE